ncbi:MAG: AAA family ATPase [Catenulispora sp.]|nr:AAA family ATPase [Catenulispora sp.]
MEQNSMRGGWSQPVGRAPDVRMISEYLRTGQGRCLHIVGDAGMGKTTVLNAVAEAVVESGARVLRADGVEFEADVAHAGLHQLLVPVLDLMGELSLEHRVALDVALGMGTGPAPSRLVVVNAVLSLVRLAADQAPVLLIVDDPQWLDRASVVVLSFVARRLAGTKIGFLAASRTGLPVQLDRRGHTRFELAPLDETSARLLLSERFPDLAPKVRDRIVAEAQGNPLALLELPGQLSPSQRTAQEELPPVLSLGERTRALYDSRVAALPPAARRVLLLAALTHGGDLGVVWSAASADPGAAAEAGSSAEEGGPVPVAEILALLAAAERDRLISVDTVARRVIFRHPLIRSAAVDASTLAERRAAHLALAAASAARPEVRAWHLAEAAIEPDETVARLLQESAHAVLRRGDSVGAVAALVRAADLSPAPADRSRRLAEAAFIGAEATGDIAKASDLLRRAQSGPAGPVADSTSTSADLHCAAAAVYVLINNDADLDTVHRMLVGAIQAAGPHYDAGDQALNDALHTLRLVCWWGGREELWAAFQEAIARLVPAPPAVLASVARSFADPARTGQSARPVLDEVSLLTPRTADPTAIIGGATAAHYPDRAGETCDRLWEIVRSGRAGAESPRRYLGALMHLSTEDFLTGEWVRGQQLVDEGMVLCTAGYPFFAFYFQFNQILLHAVRGESDAGNALAERMLRWAARRGVGAAAAFAHQARTLVCLSSGDYEAAYRHATALTPAGRLTRYTPHALWGMFDLVEAAVRTGRADEAAAHLRVLRELGVARLSDRHAMLVAAVAGLCAPDGEASPHFQAALATPQADRWVFDAARIRLAFGERLRRTAGRADAREMLTAASDAFTQLGAVPWAERARKELRATGWVTGPMSGVRIALTPQELEIAQMAATGMTNKQIGERLYLSHRTVAAHLYQVFPKLGITSRAALRDALTTVYDDEVADAA